MIERSCCSNFWWLVVMYKSQPHQWCTTRICVRLWRNDKHTHRIGATTKKKNWHIGNPTGKKGHEHEMQQNLKFVFFFSLLNSFDSQHNECRIGWNWRLEIGKCVLCSHWLFNIKSAEFFFSFLLSIYLFFSSCPSRQNSFDFMFANAYYIIIVFHNSRFGIFFMA